MKLTEPLASTLSQYNRGNVRDIGSGSFLFVYEYRASLIALRNPLPRPRPSPSLVPSFPSAFSFRRLVVSRRFLPLHPASSL
jgi:hypothetical protein